MSELYIVWFKNEKLLLECLCMNLNLNYSWIFLFYFFFKHRPILLEKLCKYLILFISGKQKIYVWLQH